GRSRCGLGEMHPMIVKRVLLPRAAGCSLLADSLKPKANKPVLLGIGLMTARRLPAARSKQLAAPLRVGPALTLSNPRGITFACERERRNHPTGHAHARAIARDTIILGQHPN